MKVTRSQKSEVRSQRRIFVFCRLPSVVCCLFFAFCLLPTQVVCARHVSSTELVENSRFYNGKTVAYQGEAVGDVMVRGDYAWIHVNDDRYSVLASNKDGRLAGYNQGQSVWLKASEVKKITYVGGYKQSGDIVRVEGVFNQACPEHGGEMDIHAEKLDVLERGAPFECLLDFGKVAAAGILALLSLGLYFLYRVVRKRRLAQSKI